MPPPDEQQHGVNNTICDDDDDDVAARRPDGSCPVTPGRSSFGLETPPGGTTHHKRPRTNESDEGGCVLMQTPHAASGPPKQQLLLTGSSTSSHFATATPTHRANDYVDGSGTAKLYQRSRRPSVDSITGVADAQAKQLELLQQENLCLQSDNAVLLSQLEEQTACLSAVTFDLERARLRLEELNAELPESMFRIVASRVQLPNVDILSGHLPDALLEQAGLTDDERADFSSVQALVSSVNDLQVRLRESHIRSASVADERIRQLEEMLAASKAELDTVVKAREMTEKRLEEDTRHLVHSRDVAVSRIAVLESELADLAAHYEASKRKEQLEVAELQLEAKDEQIASLQENVVALTAELDSARAECHTVRAGRTATQKELEYFTASLERERDYAAALRTERDTLLDDINNARTSLAEATSEVVVLQGKVDLLERASRSKDADIENWKTRVTSLQQQLTEELTRWDTSLKQAMSQLSRSELDMSAAVARAAHFEAELAAKTEELQVLGDAKAAAALQFEEKLRDLRTELERSEAHARVLQQQLAEREEHAQATEQEKQVLVAQLMTVENQAQLLKERYPQLDFEVMEEQLQSFEEEKRHAAEQLAETRQRLDAAESRLASLQTLLEATQKSAAHYEDVAAEATRHEQELEATVQAHLKTLEDLQQRLAEREQRDAALMNELDAVKRSLSQAHDALREKEQLFHEQQERHDEAVRLLHAEIDEARHAATRETVDIEGERHARRLEIQAHSRDLERLERTQQELERARQLHTQEVSQLTTRLGDLESTLATRGLELAELKRKETSLESERTRLVAENEGLRKVMQEKLDTLEISDDTLKTQLAESLRGHEWLRREADQARVDAERARLELQSAQSLVEKLQARCQTMTTELEAARIELSASQTASALEESHQQQLGLLQVRYDRLSQDYKHMTELRRQTEKQLQTLMAETEPIRRRDALLQGEVEELKNLLTSAERDAQAYKQKYLSFVKGSQAELDQKVAELTEELTSLKRDFETQRLQLTQEHMTAQAEIDRLKAETERLTQEYATAKSQHQTVLAQLQSQRGSQHTDSSEIQKRYQVQVSNLQRLLQQVNQEKDQLKAEVTKSQQLLQQEQGVRARLTQQQKVELQTLKEQLATTEKHSHVFSQILEESVRVGLMSQLLVKQFQEKVCNNSVIRLQKEEAVPLLPPVQATSEESTNRTEAMVQPTSCCSGASESIQEDTPTPALPGGTASDVSLTSASATGPPPPPPPLSDVTRTVPAASCTSTTATTTTTCSAVTTVPQSTASTANTPAKGPESIPPTPPTLDPTVTVVLLSPATTAELPPSAPPGLFSLDGDMSTTAAHFPFNSHQNGYPPLSEVPTGVRHGEHEDHEEGGRPTGGFVGRTSSSAGNTNNNNTSHDRADGVPSTSHATAAALPPFVATVESLSDIPADTTMISAPEGATTTDQYPIEDIDDISDTHDVVASGCPVSVPAAVSPNRSRVEETGPLAHETLQTWDTASDEVVVIESDHYQNENQS